MDKRIHYLKKYSDKKSTVLDAGSGEFGFAKYALEFNNKLVCSDITRPSLDNPSGYNFIQSSIEDLPFADNSFDFIYCITVLQYMRDEEVTMGEFYRILKPGGKLLLIIPTALSPFRVLRDMEISFGVYNRLYIPPFMVKEYHYYNRNRIKKIMADHFELVELVGYHYNFVPRLMQFIFWNFYKIIDFLRLGGFVKFLKTRRRKIIKDKSQQQNSEYTNQVIQQLKKEIVKQSKSAKGKVCLISDFSYHYIVVLQKK